MRVDYKDLREFLSRVEAFGELKTIHGAHWDKDMGAITEILYREKGRNRLPFCLTGSRVIRKATGVFTECSTPRSGLHSL